MVDTGLHQKDEHKEPNTETVPKVNYGEALFHNTKNL